MTAMGMTEVVIICGVIWWMLDDVVQEIQKTNKELRNIHETINEIKTRLGGQP